MSEEATTNYIKGRCPSCKGVFIIKEAINHYNTTNNFFYDIKDSEVHIHGSQKEDFEIVGGVLKKYTGASTTPVIPDTVTIIGGEAFHGCVGITSVSIPSTVISIKGSAFRSCDGLRTITLPNSIKEIGSSAFKYCVSLEEITIPTSVKQIEVETFEGCESLKRVNLGSGLLEIQDKAFFKCNQLEKCDLPSSLQVIGESSFEGCTKLAQVTLPDSLTKLGKRAFIDCVGLNGNLVMPNGLSEISESAFAYTNIKSIKFGKVKTIGKWAFESNDKLWMRNTSKLSWRQKYSKIPKPKHCDEAPKKPLK